MRRADGLRLWVAKRVSMGENFQSEEKTTVWMPKSFEKFE